MRGDVKTFPLCGPTVWMIRRSKSERGKLLASIRSRTPNFSALGLPKRFPVGFQSSGRLDTGAGMITFSMFSALFATSNDVRLRHFTSIASTWLLAHNCWWVGALILGFLTIAYSARCSATQTHAKV